MNHALVFLVLAAVLVLSLWLWSGHRRSLDRKQREQQRRLELILQPRETVKQLCPQPGGRCILTSQRLIFDIHGSIHAVSVRSIRQCQGYTAQGKRTSSVAQMKTLTIKAKQDYIIENTGEAFAELAKPLLAKVKKQNEKKKEKASAKAEKHPD